MKRATGDGDVMGVGMQQSDSSIAMLEQYCNPPCARSVPSLENFLEVLVPLLIKQNACACWIFGSHARGVACAESDIDVIVVAHSGRPFVERPLDYVLAIPAKYLPIDMLVYTPGEFRAMLEEGRLFLWEALRTAVRVYVGQ